MERVIEIQNDGHYLNLNRGFLVVSKDGQEVSQIPVEDIGVLILGSKNGGISFNLINRLMDDGAMIVLCGSTYHPAALLWPVVSHAPDGEKNRIIAHRFSGADLAGKNPRHVQMPRFLFLLFQDCYCLQR